MADQIKFKSLFFGKNIVSPSLSEIISDFLLDSEGRIIIQELRQVRKYQPVVKSNLLL